MQVKIWIQVLVQLSSATSHWLLILHGKIRVIVADLSEAFDTVDYAMLLRHLKSDIRIRECALGLFTSSLMGQAQRVVIGYQLLSVWDVSCGGPQGAILSSMLLNIYVKLLEEIIVSFGTGYHQVYIIQSPSSTVQVLS